MKRRGSSLLETAMFVPVLLLLLVGMVELARVTYVYYTLHKTMYTLARHLGTRQGAHLCDAADAEVINAKNFALTGSYEEGQPTLNGLTADMLQVRLERYSADTSSLGACECSLTGCDTAAGGQPPDFIVVSIPEGYQFRLNFPYLTTDPILLRPTIRVPFGGT